MADSIIEEVASQRSSTSELGESFSEHNLAYEVQHSSAHGAVDFSASNDSHSFLIKDKY